MRGEFFSKEAQFGAHRQIAPGVSARLISGQKLMISLVTVEPNCSSEIHSHDEEQWGFVLDGGGIRFQDGEGIAVGTGDLWRTPGNVPHGFRAGPAGARLLDIFCPPRRDI